MNRNVEKYIYYLYERMSNAQGEHSCLGPFQEGDRKKVYKSIALYMMGSCVGTADCSTGTVNSTFLSGWKDQSMSSDSNPLRLFCRRQENKIQF